jgi:DNA-binding response OmpR family regulator
MSSAKKRILCVDDDDDTCQMLTVFLGQAGYDVVSASSASEATTLIQDEHFDLLILDLWLKDGGTTELFREVRSFDVTTPIIIYSADARQKTRENLQEANVQAFLTKPEGLDIMIETAQRLMQ